METARTNTDGFAYLVKISPDSNNNRYYRMIAQGDAFLIEKGRIGATPVTSRRTMMLWYTTLKRKLAEGYEDRSALCRVDVEKESKYGKISDRDVRTLVDTLQRYANVMLDETYSVSYQDVSQSMIDEAQELIYQISEHQNDLDICRESFKKLFVVIPRKMKDVQEMLPKKADDIPVMLLREQDILDVMTAKISQSSTVTENSSKATVLDSLGLDIRLCTSEENTQIKRFLSKESSLYFKPIDNVKKAIIEIMKSIGFSSAYGVQNASAFKKQYIKNMKENPGTEFDAVKFVMRIPGMIRNYASLQQFEIVAEAAGKALKP